MSSEASPSGKRGAVSNEIDTIIPLLFAAHPDFKPSYQKMVAMDKHGRTYAALEHKFRKWRQTGREIAAASPNDESPVAKPKTKRAPKNSEGAMQKQADIGDEEDDVEKKETITVKEEQDENGAVGPAAGADVQSSKGTTNSHQKRALTEDAVDGSSDTKATTKKPKVQKKGTAQKVKPKPTARGTLYEESSEYESGSRPVKRRTKEKTTTKNITKKQEDDVEDTEAVDEGDETHEMIFE